MHSIPFIITSCFISSVIAVSYSADRGPSGRKAGLWNEYTHVKLQPRTLPKESAASLVPGGTGGRHGRPMLRVERGAHTVFRSLSPQRLALADLNAGAASSGHTTDKSVSKGQLPPAPRPQAVRSPDQSPATSKSASSQPGGLSSKKPLGEHGLQRPTVKHSVVLATAKMRPSVRGAWPYAEQKKSALDEARNFVPPGILNGKAQTVTIIGHGPAKIEVGNEYRRFGKTNISPGKVRALTIHSKHDVDGVGSATGPGGYVTAVGSGIIPSAQLTTGAHGSAFIHAYRGDEPLQQKRLGEHAASDVYNGFGRAERYGKYLKQDHTITAGVANAGKIEAFALSEGYADEAGNQVKGTEW